MRSIKNIFRSCFNRVTLALSRIRKGRPIVHLYAVCKNEAHIIPYFLNHYGAFVDTFIIYDNGSTDESLKLLKSHPKTVVKSFDTNGFMDSGLTWKLKNSAWKSSRGKADFVIVCDMDELLYNPDPATWLRMLKKCSYTVVRPEGYQMVSEKLPPFNDEPITTVIRTGVMASDKYSKTVLFDPGKITEINFAMGCHTSEPSGNVKIFSSEDTKLLHYKYIDRELVLNRHRQNRENMSPSNKKHGWGVHYMTSDEEAVAKYDALLAQGEIVV